jgi:hypothetical protein
VARRPSGRRLGAPLEVVREPVAWPRFFQSWSTLDHHRRGSYRAALRTPGTAHAMKTCSKCGAAQVIDELHVASSGQGLRNDVVRDRVPCTRSAGVQGCGLPVPQGPSLRKLRIRRALRASAGCLSARTGGPARHHAGTFARRGFERGTIRLVFEVRRSDARGRRHLRPLAGVTGGPAQRGPSPIIAR